LSTHDATRARFAATADRIAALQERRAGELAVQVRDFLPAAGEERALDAGAGTGALAFALAPLVREVVGVDSATDLLDAARRGAPPNVTFVEGDAAHLPFERGEFDLTATFRLLHHVPRPELVVAELTRVTRPGGTILVADQLGHTDPLVSLEVDRFERARDPSHTRLLPDGDLRALFEANGLVLRRARREQEARDLDAFIAYAGCEGDSAERARALAPSDPYRVEIGWYLLRRP
jgi:ubiquinone/menaquinone biosynthesis C-methylase UbiE